MITPGGGVVYQIVFGVKIKLKGKCLKLSGEICRILQNCRCFRIFKVFPFCLKSRNFYTKYNFLLASI